MVNTNTIFWYHIQYMGLLFSLTLKAYHIGTKQQTGYINFVLVVSAMGGGLGSAHLLEISFQTGTRGMSCQNHWGQIKIQCEVRQCDHATKA